jgi:hypothetical protein
MTRISRRELIAGSAATALAGFPPLAAFWNPSEHPSNGRITLKTVGNPYSGYKAQILFDGRPVAQNMGEGEFSAVFHNPDRSLEDRIEHWRASSCTESEDQLRFAGGCQLRNLKATIFVQVEWTPSTNAPDAEGNGSMTM